MKFFNNLKLFRENLKNTIDFNLRNALKLKRKVTHLKNEPKQELFDSLPEEIRTTAIEKELIFYKKYNLKHLKNNSTKLEYIENLTVLEILENYFSQTDIKHDAHVLDVGSKNWHYIEALHNFFKNKAPNVSINGIEIDAYRMYINFHTRYDYAMHRISHMPNVSYIAADVLEHKDKYDDIMVFYPFVTPEPLMSWGLPLSKLKPIELIKHLYDILNPGGRILIVNQFEDEYTLIKTILDDLKCEYKDFGEYTSSFACNINKRFVLLIL